MHLIELVAGTAVGSINIWKKYNINKLFRCFVQTSKCIKVSSH